MLSDEQKYKIAVLAEDASSKRLAYEYLGMRNTFGLDAVERNKLDIEYAIACAEYYAAENSLQRAIRAEAGETSEKGG